MRQINALVLCVDYPNLNDGKAMAYVHTRNVWLNAHGVDVKVVNFSTSKRYTIDGIEVYPSECLSEEQCNDADIWIIHAPNIRNHYRFLKRANPDTPRLFFFHGHEVLKLNESYPRDYDYLRRTAPVAKLVQGLYDRVKLQLWSRYFSRKVNDNHLVFVSQWMKDEFFRNTGLNADEFESMSSIIPNVVAEPFLAGQYDCESGKKYDFISIRGNLDNSKYCTDVVCDLAQRLPNLSFLVVGAGQYFEHRAKPHNIEWCNKPLSHEQMTQYLDCAKCALMPTRLDAQGVAMCEMATYGIPVLTTDLPICKEMLGSFPNVKFFSIDSPDYNGIEMWVNSLQPTRGEKCLKFSIERTVAIEKELICHLVEKSRVLSDSR